MTHRTIQRINRAIRDCLEHCYRCSTQLECVAAYMQQLRSREEWNAREVEHVVVAVLKILNVLVRRTDEVSV